MSQLSFDLHDEPADELGDALSMCPHLQKLEIIQQNFVFPIAKFLEQTQTCESLCLKASFTASTELWMPTYCIVGPNIAFQSIHKPSSGLTDQSFTEEVEPFVCGVGSRRPTCVFREF